MSERITCEHCGKTFHRNDVRTFERHKCKPTAAQPPHPQLQQPQPRPPQPQHQQPRPQRPQQQQPQQPPLQPPPQQQQPQQQQQQQQQPPQQQHGGQKAAKRKSEPSLPSAAPADEAPVAAVAARTTEQAPPLATAATLALDERLLQRPRAPLEAFEGSWVCSDWHESQPPRSYSGFLLPLIYSGLGSVEPVSVPDAAKHYGGRRPATAASIAAAQRFWEAVFSSWAAWAGQISAAHARGELDPLLRRVSSRATTLVPRGVAGLDAWLFGAVPHLAPNAQNELIERALGPAESAHFYMAVSLLFQLAAQKGAAA